MSPSKFRGPFDKEHQKRLAAWSFDRAMVERPRSLDLSMSPCAPDEISPFDSDDTGDISPDDDGVPIDIVAARSHTPESTISTDFPRPAHTGSQSSTIVNSDSYNGSMMTLLPEISVYEIPEDPITQFKESIRFTSPIVRAISPALKSPRAKQLPFCPRGP
ncbi:hypothetical protein N7454_010404 [Penicillium verhagenii]|nr:hypothetical protein N7454_010404 [Penicillium verhagenii]